MPLQKGVMNATYGCVIERPSHDRTSYLDPSEKLDGPASASDSSHSAKIAGCRYAPAAVSEAFLLVGRRDPPSSVYASFS